MRCSEEIENKILLKRKLTGSKWGQVKMGSGLPLTLSPQINPSTGNQQGCIPVK
jgi:hypothetical protein